MKETLVEDRLRPARVDTHLVDALARGFVHRALARLRDRCIRIVERGRVFEFGAPGKPPAATLVVRDPRAYRAVVFGGTIGAAEAYMDGLWSSDDLAAAVSALASSPEAHYGLEGGLARLLRPLRSLRHFMNRNTREGSRRNIAAHYDLGNDFYRLFLDDTLAYSCGIFESETATMRQASEAKFERIARKLALSPSDHVLEIGTGWGGFAIHAARHFGARVTTTTLSREQHELARERVRAAGLGGRVEVLVEDYRDLSGVYDKLVSIEMIEAVGHQYLDTFFARCARLLHPRGQMLLQSITIADQDYDRHRRDLDFIKRYIFPGASIPSVTALVSSMTRASDLRLFALDDISRHYVLTLRRWREAFHANLDAVRELGFSERFTRMWDFYLAYCEGGFAERYLGDVQLLLVKPGFRPNPAAS
ncbi:MAG TPA: cyclopropane-fatty-acyl-phospholipid synthase family protein [Vicinamibacteria bacterium]